MSKTYKKVHQSDKALAEHKRKIRNRGGVIDDQEGLGYGNRIKYHFPKKK